MSCGAEIGGFGWTCGVNPRSLVGAVRIRPLSSFSRIQAMADVRDEIHLAMVTRHENKIQEESKTWMQVAARHWSHMSLAAPDMPNPRQIPRHRAKSYEWLLAPEHMLWVATVTRWADWAQPEVPAEINAPEDWPIMTVSVNQFSDGWCGAWFLMMHMCVGILLLKDTSHRLWNDVCVRFAAW